MNYESIMKQQKEQLKLQLSKEDNVTDEEIYYLLNTAKMIILNRRYPFQDYPVDEETGEFLIENRYLNLQMRIAIELFAKEGVEGQTSHTENAVTRNYASAGISGSLLNEIVPKGKVISSAKS